jgi:uncharacterized membrane protein YfcA
VPWEVIAFGSAAILVAAGIQVVSGFGFALLAAPVLFTLLPPSTAVPALVGLSLTQVIGVLIHERGVPARGRGRVFVIAVAALPTLIIGALLLESLSRRVLLIAVGVIVFLTLLQRLRLRAPASADAPLQGGGSSAVVTGLVAGFLTTTVTVNGPPMVAYFGHVGANRAEFRRGLAALFLVLDLAAIIVLVLVDTAATFDGALVTLVLIPALVLGHVIGLRVAGRLDDARWNRLVFLLLAATGVAALVRAFV